MGRFQQKLFHAGTEADLTAKSLNLSAQPSHHCRQLEGADMGSVTGQDVAIGATVHQFLQHFAAVMNGIAHLAVELAIGKGSSTPFAELHIGFGLERRLTTPESERVSASLLHRLSALQQQWAKSHLRKQQCCEITTGSCPNHHRPRP